MPCWLLTFGKGSHSYWQVAVHAYGHFLQSLLYPQILAMLNRNGNSYKMLELAGSHLWKMMWSEHLRWSGSQNKVSVLEGLVTRPEIILQKAESTGQFLSATSFIFRNTDVQWDVPPWSLILFFCFDAFVTLMFYLLFFFLFLYSSHFFLLFLFIKLFNVLKFVSMFHLLGYLKETYKFTSHFMPSWL